MRSTRVALLTLLAGVVTATSTVPAAAEAAQRYASPSGSQTACTAASPCSLRQAVEGALGGDEVVVNPGDYPLTATLTPSTGTTVLGVAGQPRPRLLFSGTGEAGKTQDGLRLLESTLRYVEIVQTSPNQAPALYASKQSSVDQVIATGGWPTADVRNSIVRNSIVTSSRDVGIAIMTAANGTNSASTLRNVTAIATGAGGIAIRSWGFAGHANVLARNVIARGGPGGHDLDARAINAGTSAKITVDYSNWVDAATDGAGASIVEGAGNQSSAPAFVDAAAGDYRQAAGSPTIDAGLDEFINGAFDVDGDPRQLFGIDIGADEFVVAPVATTGPANVTDRTASLGGIVDAQGAPTSYHFEYGPTSAYGASTSAAATGSGGIVEVAAFLSGLSAATTYHYRLVATNAGGVTKGADRTFTTASPPQPTPTPTAPAPTPTAPAPSSTPQPPSGPQAFAGVEVVSRRLTFGGRFTTLRLSCPAATVERCSGRARLTARRTGSRAVTLGRARFSIAAGNQGKVRVRVSRAGRRLLSGVRRLRGKGTVAARDGAGQPKTTVAAVTIRRRHR
jgi:hypothetical protein